jgi:hypothetical protein
MEVDVNVKSIVKIDMNCEEAFRLLVKTLNMDFILDDLHDYYTHKNEYDELSVYEKVNGKEEEFDYRGDLYEALMETARCIFPNV